MRASIEDISCIARYFPMHEVLHATRLSYITLGIDDRGYFIIGAETMLSQYLVVSSQGGVILQERQQIQCCDPDTPNLPCKFIRFEASINKDTKTQKTPYTYNKNKPWCAENPERGADE